MKHRGNAGNTHAVANYMRVAPKHGHSAAIFGTPISYVPELQFSMDIRSFDRVVYVFESEIYREKRLHEAALLARFPRRHRLILDTDGMYNPVTDVDSYDFNFRNAAEREQWIEHFDALSDKIMQTTLAHPVEPRARAMTFYGYNQKLEVQPSQSPAKQYDILLVGHNWWRWKQVSTELLPAIEAIRDQVGEIGFIGLWWDKPPPEGPAAGPEEAFQSDPEALRRLRIRTGQAVMYHDVIKVMSTARVNIFTQRPLLQRLKHLTLKYFEVFCADTIPLLMLDGDHAEAVYGKPGRELVLTGNVAGKLLDALHRPDYYRGVVGDVRRHLTTHYSYDDRVEELVSALRN